MSGNTKVLFVTEKWCDGDPTKGLTNSVHNLFGSLANSKNCEISTIHYDELLLTKQTHINNVLVSICSKVSPDIVIFSFLGDSPVNPSDEILQEIKNTGIKICIIWHDTGYNWAQNRIRRLVNIADIQISLDNSTDFEECNLVNTFTPQDETLYFPDIKSIPYSFIGSLKGYKTRSLYLNKAKEIITDLFITGGQREAKLTSEKYAEFIRTSKIGINFPESPSGEDQLKGRVTEILSCRSMLLEKSNKVTSRFLTPGEDYVEFYNPDDFIDKLSYYKDNDKDRMRIAENGYRKYIKQFSPLKFWDIIFNTCGQNV